MKKQIPNEPDIVGLITKMQEQLTALDKKVDLLLNRSTQQPAGPGSAPKTPFYLPVSGRHQGNEKPRDHHKERPMFRAVCADCKKECELPFKPSGDRPVFCKECFSRRKANNNFKVAADHRPQGAPPAQTIVKAAVDVLEPIEKEKKKPAATKKPAAGKKTVSKKKKK
ncbi:MAG TPA: hypothetical protein PL155_06750 [Candidatus Omnitrophota bacterium]|nr:hypothetical protein [Candidatus Omnitrophota bacterium]HPD85593.1 hypothetical protein [Candidatus Omnitrophota bacterium]HRZ04521.1 hypothetical protein [Candidatus Omnitrophota bacterium]